MATIVILSFISILPERVHFAGAIARRPNIKRRTQRRVPVIGSSWLNRLKANIIAAATACITDQRFIVQMASDTMLTLLFGAISLLYATVGQAGGTSFLALMAFASFSPNEMRPTALLLNVVAASYSTWRFNRDGLVKWAKLVPLLIASLPTALVGGLIVLNEHIYKTITGFVFLLAAMVLAFRRTSHGELERPTPLWAAIGVGSVIGFASGLTGVGGGVFFAPLLIALHWASPKRTVALSAPYNLANSVLGLVGVIYAGQVPAAHTWLYAVATLVGAIIGTSLALRSLSQTMTRYVLATILGAAGVQFLFF